MIAHKVSVHMSAHALERDQQLAWKIAQMAAARPRPDADVVQMIINRVIDNTAVALASVNRRPVATARAQAIAHLAHPGASIFGAATSVSPEWAAWANGVAVRELDYHDTYLAADYAHPADNIPALLAVAQHCGRSGADLCAGIAVAYETQVALVRGICLHEHKIDHIAHLGPSAAAGIGAVLGLDAEIIYQAVQQAVHCTLTTRQSRKGLISSWKAFAPAHACKLAVEAVDRAMRGEGAPSPIYEGEDSIISYVLNGRSAREQGKNPLDPSYTVMLPAPGAPCRAILETYTKEHSAEYQSQALIDLAIRMRASIDDLSQIARVRIYTSHHTHNVIGTGSGDPQKMDPAASRETLDHSAMYIFAVALQDGGWHHHKSYSPQRAGRADTLRLWHAIENAQDPKWTARYHHPDPAKRAFGATVEIELRNGAVLRDEMAVANAHPNGAKPFVRADYVGKFHTLSQDVLTDDARAQFLAAAEQMPALDATGLGALVPRLPAGAVRDNPARGIF